MNSVEGGNMVSPRYNPAFQDERGGKSVDEEHHKLSKIQIPLEVLETVLDEQRRFRSRGRSWSLDRESKDQPHNLLSLPFAATTNKKEIFV
eukprot:TRINITY_DN8426_c0_g1_i1.p2 TRINITY_DN8426_c0_g1~~TRINITY_DN8426_c0_g1_i1.p2  ORF type:complete len:91 (+),score=5.18 TRINITY_DN8426_c0_g1_i1:303-575(+)